VPGARIIQTGRLVLSPVAWGDLEDLQRLKCDPLVFGQMLGGVRQPSQVTAELAEDTAFWARHGSGMWMVRDARTRECYGLTGVHERPDGRGAGLRFAFTPASRGHGYAREAAGAALRHAHDRGHFERVVAVAKESNFSSRMVLGAIGMRECATFERNGDRMLMFESLQTPRP
jgi:RimJ/RimL family protein N-acetyltransferase